VRLILDKTSITVYDFVAVLSCFALDLFVISVNCLFDSEVTRGKYPSWYCITEPLLVSYIY
jgi:hypothetical protein